MRRAIRLWTESIEAGCYCYVMSLAPCYDHGIGVDVDLQKAAELYKIGSETKSHSWTQDCVQAFYGMCLVRGEARNKMWRRDGLLFVAQFGQTKTLDASHKHNVTGMDMVCRRI